MGTRRWGARKVYLPFLCVGTSQSPFGSIQDLYYRNTALHCCPAHLHPFLKGDSVGVRPDSSFMALFALCSRLVRRRVPATPRRGDRGQNIRTDQGSRQHFLPPVN